MQDRKKITIIVSLLLLLVLGYLLFDKKIMSNRKVIPNNNATTTEETGVKVSTTEGSGGYTIKKISEATIPATTIKMPDLARAVQFLDSINNTDEVKKMISEKVLSLQSDLKKDPTTITKWVDLGMYYKMAGDYEGAVIYWKYITQVVPNDFISFGNLGDLYAYYIKDGKTSEMYYKKAIANAPKQVYLYTQLAGVYKDVFKDLDKARAIIEQGLRALPGDQALIEFKNNLK